MNNESFEALVVKYLTTTSQIYATTNIAYKFQAKVAYIYKKYIN